MNYLLSLLLVLVVGVESFSGVQHHFPKKARSFVSLRLPILYAQQNDDSESSISTPFDRPVLAAVDVAALMIFAGVGKASHSADGSLDVAAVAMTAAPFVASWLLTSPVTGIYTPDNRGENLILGTAIKTAKGWALAVPLGCALRGVIKGYVPPLPFVIVTLIATLVILCGARIIFSVAEDFFVELVN